MWSSYPLTWVLLSLLHWASINLMQNALHTPSLLLLAHFPFRLRLAGACPSDGSHLLPPLLYLQLISHCQHLPRLPSQRRLVFLHSRWAEASLGGLGRAGGEEIGHSAPCLALRMEIAELSSTGLFLLCRSLLSLISQAGQAD